MSTVKPVIGITTYGRDRKGDFHLPGDYVDAVRRAGGMPVLLAPGESDVLAVLDLMDGLIFAGGGDIDPRRYKGVSHATIDAVDEERDAFEIELAIESMSHALPVLGICRGSQLLNVASGGDLVVDIPERFGRDINHRGDNGQETLHEVELDPASRLGQLLGKIKTSVVSKHHQGFQNIPSVWRVSTHAADGVTEALEHKEHPWMFAVLWHPEMAPDDPVQQKIFQALVEAAQHF